MAVHLQNRQRALLLDSTRCLAWLRGLCDAAGWKTEELTVRILSAKAIRAMNLRFRGEDEYTDVLAFPAEMPRGAQGPRIVGDIAISGQAVVEQAREYGHPEEEELKLLVAHGVAHLLGYDDSTETDRKRIRKLEQELIHAADVVLEKD